MCEIGEFSLKPMKRSQKGFIMDDLADISTLTSAFTTKQCDVFKYSKMWLIMLNQYWDQ